MGTLQGYHYSRATFSFRTQDMIIANDLVSRPVTPNILEGKGDFRKNKTLILLYPKKNNCRISCWRFARESENSDNFLGFRQIYHKNIFLIMIIMHVTSIQLFTNKVRK